MIVIDGATGIDKVQPGTVDNDELVHHVYEMVRVEPVSLVGLSLKDLGNFPAWVKRITIFLSSFSTNGSSVPLVRLSDGSIKTTGYFTVAVALVGGQAVAGITNTDGFRLANTATAAGNTAYGKIVLEHIGNNVWNFDSTLAYPNVSLQKGEGQVSLSGSLVGIRLTTINGTDTIDLGTLSYMYEG